MTAAWRYSHLALIPVLLLTGLPSSAHAHEHGEGKLEEKPASARPGPGPGARAAQPPAWTGKPVLVIAGRPEGSTTPMAAKGLEAEQLIISSPDLKQAPVLLPKTGGRWMAMPPASGVGGYHWLSARSEGAGEILTASSMLMFPGKGLSPQALLTTYGKGLDLRPLRIPERGGFREESAWDFGLRFDGLPVADTVLTLETENGSQLRFKSNADGIVRVAFPKDFKAEDIDKDAGATRTRRNFVISAEIVRDGIHYVSAFNHFYYPDLMRERSLAWGAGFTLLGMVMATPLLRRREKSHV